MFNISKLIKASVITISVLALTGCGFLRDRLKDKPVTRVQALLPDQACDATEQTEKRLSGAYLRQAATGGLSFDPVLIAGRSSGNGLAPDVDLNDQSQEREVADLRGTTFVGTKSATAAEREGFGPTAKLPNVYDVTYSINDADFTGPMVVGPSSVLSEIPTSGRVVYQGRIDITVTTIEEDGTQKTQKATGRFAMQAGFATLRGSFTANGFGDAIQDFDSLNWTNLFLCGTRFVSSGKGIVGVKKTADGPALAPFKSERDPAPFRALFEAAQFAPTTRPAPPVGFGGIFVIQSDKGTLTAAFLSDRVATQEEEEEQDD